ncbi:hypothetical protein LWS69_07765, partial [Bordetella hinzii]|nr:hypothetical protein [Bordetella hinzii]
RPPPPPPPPRPPPPPPRPPPPRPPPPRPGAPLPAADVVLGADGARVRVQAGASPSPWYELVYEDNKP